jgi:molybdopterin-biosynthesis enzyme MoeA-like protein
MPDANKKQAYLPTGSLRIDNPRGTAPGFALRFQRCWFVFMPGVPAEMQAMFATLIKPDLLQRFKLQTDTLITLRSIGIGESAIQQALENLKLPTTIKLGFRVTPDEVQTKLLFPGELPAFEREQYVAEVAALIGDFIFAIDGPDTPQNDLISVISYAMQLRQLKLAVLETASHGMIAAKCVNQSWLLSVDISLDKGLQTAPLEITAQTLAEQLVADKTDTLALVQLYHQRPHESTDKNQDIVLYNALNTPQGLFSSQHHITGTPTRKQNQATLLALDLLRRYLQDKCP